MTQKKKTIKINFKDFWGYFNPYDNFFINILKKDYNVTISDNPDYVFYSVFSKKSPSYSKRFSRIGKIMKEYLPFIYRFLKEVYYFKGDRWEMPVLKGNFVKIFYSPENTKIKAADMNKCNWAFTFNYDEELKHPRHLRLPSYKVWGNWLCKEIVNKNIDTKKIKREKIKFCNFVYSNCTPFRKKIFKELNKYKKVEAWGKCCNNMEKYLPGRFPSKNNKIKSYSNENLLVWKPKDFLNKFKFTIAFENSCSPGYTTEKILEPMSVNSIPIYWGNPLIHRDFNTKSFINYHDFERKVKKRIPPFFLKVPILKFLTKKYIEGKTFKKMIKKIIEIDNNDELYEEMLKQPWYNNNKPSKYVNEEYIRKRFKEIFS